MSKLVTIYMVNRTAITAPARNSVGYGTVPFEFIAQSESDAVSQAIRACRWKDPARNFSWDVTSTRVVVVD